MAKRWAEVESSSEYQALSPQNKFLAKKDYFAEVVSNKPEFQKLGENQKIQAQDEFFGGKLTSPLSQEEFKRSQKTLPYIMKDVYEKTPFLRGLSKRLPGGEQREQIMETMPEPVGTGAQIIAPIAGGLTAAAPVMVAAPQNILGASALFGAAGTGEALSRGENVPESVLQGAQTGAMTAAGFGAGKLASVGLRKTLPAITRVSPKAVDRLGTAVGMYGSAKATGADEPSAIVSAGMGAAIPMEGTFKRQLNPAQLKARIEKNAQVYREVLRPTQGEIRNLEVKSGKNIDDYYKLAAEEGLQIDSAEGNKLDTEGARLKLKDRMLELHEQLNSALESDTTKQFNLKKIAKRAKVTVDEKVKNAKEREELKAEIDNYINAEIESAGGKLVDAKQLNNIKSGMWGVGYDPLKPNTKKAARMLGNKMKDSIESSFPDQAIKETNSRLGEYATLDTLLENAHGRVIAGGQMGRHFARLIGGMAGHNVPVVGPLIGAKVGEVASKFANSPERITKGLSESMIENKPIQKGQEYYAPVEKALQDSIEKVKGMTFDEFKKFAQSNPKLTFNLQNAIGKVGTSSEAPSQELSKTPAGMHAERNALKQIAENPDIKGGGMEEPMLKKLWEDISNLGERGSIETGFGKKKLKIKDKSKKSIYSGYLYKNEKYELKYGEDHPDWAARNGFGKNILENIKNPEGEVVKEVLKNGLIRKNQPGIYQIDEKFKIDNLKYIQDDISNDLINNKIYFDEDIIIDVNHKSNIKNYSMKVKDFIDNDEDLTKTIYKNRPDLYKYLLISASALGLASNSQASDKVDMSKIAQIESSNNEKAYNASEDAIGLHQIRKDARTEYFQAHPKEKYTRKEMFTREVNTKIADWYMNVRIPQMLRAYKIPDTVKNRIIAYNFGIGNLKNKKPLPKTTLDYLKKYGVK